MNPLQNQDFNASEISYLNKVPCPKFYKDSENNHFQFESLEHDSKINLESLLQHVSPEAVLNSTPFFEKFYCNNTQISVLNYTSELLSFSQNRNFFINGQKVLQFTSDDCHSIAYKTPELPKILCLESKNDDTSLPGTRIFFRISKNLCVPAHPKNNHQTRSLFTQIPFQIADSENYIKTNPCMNSLVQKIVTEASLNHNPSLLQFNPRTSLPRFTVLNYTEHVITFDIYKNLLINEEPLTNFSIGNCQFIAYHLEGYPALICFESKSETQENANTRFFAEVSWKQTFKPKDKNILNEIHKKRMFNSFWKSFYDKNSLISEQEIPKDIINEIMSIYFQLILLTPL